MKNRLKSLLIIILGILAAPVKKFVEPTMVCVTYIESLFPTQWGTLSIEQMKAAINISLIAKGLSTELATELSNKFFSLEFLEVLKDKLVNYYFISEQLTIDGEIKFIEDYIGTDPLRVYNLVSLSNPANTTEKRRRYFDFIAYVFMTWSGNNSTITPVEAEFLIKMMRFKNGETY